MSSASTISTSSYTTFTQFAVALAENLFLGLASGNYKYVVTWMVAAYFYITAGSWVTAQAKQLPKPLLLLAAVAVTGIGALASVVWALQYVNLKDVPPGIVRADTKFDIAYEKSSGRAVVEHVGAAKDSCAINVNISADAANASATVYKTKKSGDIFFSKKYILSNALTTTSHQIAVSSDNAYQNSPNLLLNFYSVFEATSTTDLLIADNYNVNNSQTFSYTQVMTSKTAQPAKCPEDPNLSNFGGDTIWAASAQCSSNDGSAATTNFSTLTIYQSSINSFYGQIEDITELADYGNLQSAALAVKNLLPSAVYSSNTPSTLDVTVYYLSTDATTPVASVSTDGLFTVNDSSITIPSDSVASRLILKSDDSGNVTVLANVLNPLQAAYLQFQFHAGQYQPTLRLVHQWPALDQVYQGNSTSLVQSNFDLSSKRLLATFADADNYLYLGVFKAGSSQPVYAPQRIDGNNTVDPNLATNQYIQSSMTLSALPSRPRLTWLQSSTPIGKCEFEVDLRSAYIYF